MYGWTDLAQWSTWDGPMVFVDRDWCDRPVLDVARELLGARVTARAADGVVVVRLTEVEAYGGADDPGSHAFGGNGRRNATMFGEPGGLYVYRHLGLHHCVNVVCGPPGTASAVLLRAGEIVEGADVARSRRVARGTVHTDRDLASGPARLAVALGVDLSDDGAELAGAGGRLAIELPGDRFPEVDLSESSPLGRPAGTGEASTGRPVIATGPRVGVGGEGGSGQRFPWRMWLAGEPTVSAYRPAGRRSTKPPAVK